MQRNHLCIRAIKKLTNPFDLPHSWKKNQNITGISVKGSLSERSNMTQETAADSISLEDLNATRRRLPQDRNGE